MSDRFKTATGGWGQSGRVTLEPVKASGRLARPGLVLGLVCGTQFMVVLDLVVVNVALPSIQSDLGLGQSQLQWIVISYGLTLGGFLLLGGRAADLLGRRNVLIAGLVTFTVASVGAGVSGSFAQLVVSRAVQGLGAAMAAPAALSILTGTFDEGRARNRALGMFGGVAGSAASVGLIVSGVLTGGPGWRWIFLINLPIGIALGGLVVMFIAKERPIGRGSADVLGAVTVTAGMLVIVYAVNKSVDHGWTSPATVGTLLAGVAVLGVFVIVERRTARPLIPLSIFRLRTLTTANIVAALVMGAFFGTAFQTTLYMQQVLDYSPLRTGAANLIGAACSVFVAGAITSRVVARVGAATTIVIGQGFALGGLLHLSRIPVEAAYWSDLFPAFVALGIGIGLSGVAIQVAAFVGVEDKSSGLVGGMISTAQEAGAALGLAIIATAAIARSAEVEGAARSGPAVGAVALTEGFQRGALVAAMLSIVAALASGVLMGRAERTADIVDDPTPQPALSAT